MCSCGNRRFKFILKELANSLSLFVKLRNPQTLEVNLSCCEFIVELCPKVVRGVKSRGYLVVKLLCLNPVFELYTFYHFPKLPESSQPAPVVLRTQTQLEHHAQHPLSA